MPTGILPGGAEIPSASVWILWPHLLHRRHMSLTGLVDTWCFSLAAQTPLEFLNIERHPPHGPLEACAGLTGPSRSSSRWALAGAGASSPLLVQVGGWNQQHHPPRKSYFQPQISLTSDILSEALPKSSGANSWNMLWWGLGPNSD